MGVTGALHQRTIGRGHTIWAMRSHTLRPESSGVDEDTGWPRYEIRVGGVLSPTLLCAFPSLSAVSQGSETRLTGGLPDQAALHGVLAEIEALGLELLEVRRM
jgi:hypothetical protein